MITATTGTSNPITFNASVAGLAVYLDNFALKDLAKGDPLRRRRFVSAIHSGAELLFSVSNAAELSGPRDGSFVAIRSFLNEIEAHWFPVELDPFEVTNREVHGARADHCCISKRFMNDYFNARVRSYLPGTGRVIDLSEQFFRLGPVMDWLAPQRESIRAGKEDLDQALLRKIRDHRTMCEADKDWLDKAFPLVPFNPSIPATFTYVNLIRNLILEAKSHSLKKGDGIDFCHAFMAAAFSSIGTLDKHWKRRVEALPKPNALARIYYAPELDTMVEHVEAEVRRVTVARDV